MKNLVKASIPFLAIASALSASSFSLQDTSFSLTSSIGEVKADEYYQVRWGTFSGGSFNILTESVANDADTGYLSLADSELSVNVNFGDNSKLALNQQVVMVISLLAFAAAYQATESEIVLSDPSWLAPEFGLLAPSKTVQFTENTVALKGGTFSFNGGNELIAIGAAIPEPSSFAAFAGLAVLGAVASRRRRSA